MNENELKKVLTAHTRWLDGKEGGTRADLWEADLREEEFYDLRVAAWSTNENLASKVADDLRREYPGNWFGVVSPWDGEERRWE